MADGSITELKRRGVVAVGGPDAETFLNDLITAEIGRAAPGQALYAGLLTPQGKVMFDFIIIRDGERFMFDVAREAAPALAKRLLFYRLRAKVTVEDLSDHYRVAALWSPHGVFHIDGIAAPDPRLASLGWRMILPVEQPLERKGFAPATEPDYDAHRIALGIPEGGIDFAFGDAFPHDIDMDQLGGVDFDKGCYVGQEVVSRMQHRRTARRRFVVARVTGGAPAIGTEVLAGGKALGRLGSAADGFALAELRLDRTKEAMDSGAAIEAGGARLEPSIPGWARFTWPEPGKAVD
jgi:folate-binding protein YgfZ